LATTLTLPTPLKVEQARQKTSESTFGAAFVTALTAFALAVHGYHPYAEDGGIYLAGVKRLLNPALYPSWSEFVTEHLRFSVFAPLLAALVHASHLPLMTVWLLLYVATFWLALFAAWMLAVRCSSNHEARCGAVALLAVWLTMPIAGTSLMLMDPYLSARSISTPCAMFALVGVLDFFSSRSRNHTQALVLCCSSLLLAGLVHPLMAAYALGFVLLLACLLSTDLRIRVGGIVILSSLAFLTATLLYKTAPFEGTDYVRVALTRDYWFVARWHWYEQFGLAAPLAILAAIGLRPSYAASRAARGLALAGTVAGAVAIIVASIFARTNGSTYLVARLQPLRIFQLVYILMILAVGAFLGEILLQRRAHRWIATFAVLALIMLCAERYTFPRSAHFESPGREPRNGWERAFEWIRVSTPVEALFALDANYVSQPGEDAQTFRAVAERSAIADYSKDGGEASITPSLTALWFTGQAAQTGLNTETDAKRIATLRPLGVSWVVLPTGASTGFTCGYTDEAVKVCRLPAQQ
jgi:hypothetical protein